MKSFEMGAGAWKAVSCAAWAIAFPLVGCDADDDADTDTHTETDSERDTETETETDGAQGRFTDTDTGFENAEGIVYPGVNWPKTDAASAGLDMEVLEAAAEFAAQKDSHCFVVTQGGRLVGEWYFDDWNPDTESNVFSVTKSIVSLVVGMAETEGLLSIEDPASDYVTDWQGTDSEEVRIRHLLSQTSGRFFEFNSDYVKLALAPDKTDFALFVGQAEPPGTYWEYNNTAVQALDAVLQVALGQPVHEYATEKLFAPIGATSTFTLDDAQNTMTYSDLNASCRDLARFGYLLLRDGVWGDERLIDSSYLDAAALPSSALNAAYGYLWWLNREGHWAAPATSADTPHPEGDGKMLQDVPEDIVFARGFQGQLIAIDRAHELVFTRVGGNPDPIAAFMGGIDPADDTFIQGILPLVLSAIIAQ